MTSITPEPTLIGQTCQCGHQWWHESQWTGLALFTPCPACGDTNGPRAVAAQRVPAEVVDARRVVRTGAPKKIRRVLNRR